ncbi:MAG: VTT domain-containing protein [Burkholderiaceae bacterium]|nr:VTT domain-containing protein [Burkholderiaceae bacterium]
MPAYKRLIAVVLFLGVLLAVFELSGLRDHLNLQYLHDTLVANQLLGLVLFTLVFALGNLIQIPGWIFLAAAVLALGRTMGGVATYVAAVVTCASTFVLIRLIGGNALRQMRGRVAAATLRQLDAHPVRSVTLSRLVFQTMPALNYVLAMSGVKFRSYLLGTLLGLPLPIALYCLFFDYLATAFHIHVAG